HLEDIPDSVGHWDVSVRGAATLAASLRDHRADAYLFRELAQLRLDAPIPQRSVQELRWRGVPRSRFEALVERLAAPSLLGRVPRWADRPVDDRRGATRDAACGGGGVRGGAAPGPDVLRWSGRAPRLLPPGVRGAPRMARRAPL